MGKTRSNTHWMQNAVPEKNKGLLHKKLHVPQDEKIPVKKLNKAAKKGGKLAKEANFAKTAKKIAARRKK